MTQLIDFEELKNAFATQNSATVNRLNGEPLNVSTNSRNDDQRLKELNDENRTLLSQQKQLETQLDTLDSAYQKSLRQLNALNQDQKDTDSDFQRLHEDKIRLVRSLNSKQNEIEGFKKQINQLESVERALRIKFSHSKHGIKKLQSQAEQQQAAIKNKDLHILQLKQEIEQLKQAKSLKSIANELWKVYSSQALELAEQYWQEFNDWRAKRKGGNTEIRWVPVATSLPKQQCMVYVRNGQQSDVALFNPSTKKFKCANNPFQVIEWALAK